MKTQIIVFYAHPLGAGRAWLCDRRRRSGKAAAPWRRRRRTVTRAQRLVLFGLGYREPIHDGDHASRLVVALLGEQFPGDGP